jgi:hypothetical protein
MDDEVKDENAKKAAVNPRHVHADEQDKKDM